VVAAADQNQAQEELAELVAEVRAQQGRHIVQQHLEQLIQVVAVEAEKT
jgi:hypothetical protein